MATKESAKYNIRYEDYAGRKLFEVSLKGKKPAKVSAPDEYSAMVAAAKLWGEDWTKIDFYTNVNVARMN